MVIRKRTGGKGAPKMNSMNKDQGAVPLNRKFYTTSQLMKRWGVSQITIIRIIEEGGLEGLRIRGNYRVDKASVERYEEKAAF